MNEKRTFSSRITKIAGITLALLIFFSSALTLWNANAAVDKTGTGLDAVPDDGFEIAEGDFCPDCGNYLSAEIKAEYEGNTAYEGKAPYVKIDGKFYPVTNIGICQKASCTAEGCNKQILNCDGTPYTANACEHTSADHLFCKEHCTDATCAHLNSLTPCDYCQKPIKCDNASCAICTALDEGTVCPGGCHLDEICPVCHHRKNCTHLDAPHYKAVTTNGTTTYELIPADEAACTCVTCETCGKTIATPCHEINGKNYCEDHCPSSVHAMVGPNVTDGDIAISVGEDGKLEFTVTAQNGYSLKLPTNASDITITGVGGADASGLTLKSAALKNNTNGSVIVTGVKPGNYKVSVPIIATKPDAPSQTRYANFDVEVYDSTIPTDLDGEITTTVSGLSDKLTYESGKAVKFTAEAASTNPDVTVVPTKWDVRVGDKEPYASGTFDAADAADGKVETDIKNIKSGTNTLTVYFTVTDADSKEYIVKKTVTFKAKSTSGGGNDVDTADTTQIYITAFVVSLCVLTLTVVGMSAYLKRKNNMRPAFRRFR